METVEKSCGQSGCHQNLIPIVSNSQMNKVDGMQIINKLLSILKKIRKIEVNLAVFSSYDNKHETGQ